MQSPDASGPSDLTADGRPAALLPLRSAVPDLDLLVRHQRDLGRRRRRGPAGARAPPRGPRDRRHGARADQDRRGRDGDRGPADRRDDHRLHDESMGPTQAVHRHRRVPRRALPAGPLVCADIRRGDGVRRPAPVQLELRPGSLPGLHPGPRRREAGRGRECARRDHVRPRQRRRDDHRVAGALGRPARFPDPAHRGRPDRVPHDASGRSSGSARAARRRTGPAGPGRRSPPKRGAPTSCASTAMSGWSHRACSS